ncbi:MAG TPA: sulfur carrier protein ThiS [Chthoniobacterales bacterium]|nr:sulfur carrier protein ThiS [Chthoniobacterales bacterium]
MKQTRNAQHRTSNIQTSSGMMTILLNGEKVDARGAQDIAQLVERFQLGPQTILVEHNGVALHLHEWPQRRIREGDRVELLRVVAGG